MGPRVGWRNPLPRSHQGSEYSTLLVHLEKDSAAPFPRQRRCRSLWLVTSFSVVFTYSANIQVCRVFHSYRDSNDFAATCMNRCHDPIFAGHEKQHLRTRKRTSTKLSNWQDDIDQQHWSDGLGVGYAP